jgi:hypothetical protein
VATAADALGRGEGLDLEGRGPLLPLLLAVPVAAGAPATTSLRWADAVLGALLGPLLAACAKRIGLGGTSTLVVGLLGAGHPMLVEGAGGAAAGASSATAALLLAALLLLGSAGARRRLGFAAAVLAALADPLAVLYLPGFLAVHAVGEPSRRARWVAAAAAVLAAVATPWPWAGASAPGVPALLVLWLPVASLAALLPALPGGLRRLAALAGGPRAPMRAWLLGAALHAIALAAGWGGGVALGWDGLHAGVALVPLVVLGGVAGLERFGPRARSRLAAASLAVALLGSLLLAAGPVTARLLGGSAPAAGRLGVLGEAFDAAADATGPGGWIAVDLGPGRGDEARRLADRARARSVLVLEAPSPGEDPVVRSLPARRLDQAGGGLALLTVRETAPGVTTLGGLGIWRQESVWRIGPYFLWKVSPP